MKYRLAALIFALVLTALFARPASAAFTVCNAASYGNVSVAFAANWKDSTGQSNGRSQGWWTIAQDECKIILKNDISAYQMYIYAFAASDPSNHYWGGSNQFCIDPANEFTFHGDDMDTPCSKGRAFGMRYIDTGSNSTYTYYLYD